MPPLGRVPEKKKAEGEGTGCGVGQICGVVQGPHVLAVRPWASYFTSPSLNLLIYKMGTYKVV